MLFFKNTNKKTPKTNRQVYSIPDIIPTRSTWKYPKVAHSDIFQVQNKTSISAFNFFPQKMTPIKLLLMTIPPPPPRFLLHSHVTKEFLQQKMRENPSVFREHLKKTVENLSHASSYHLSKAVSSTVNSQNEKAGMPPTSSCFQATLPHLCLLELSQTLPCPFPSKVLLFKAGDGPAQCTAHFKGTLAAQGLTRWVLQTYKDGDAITTPVHVPGLHHSPSGRFFLYI